MREVLDGLPNERRYTPAVSIQVFRELAMPVAEVSSEET